MNSKLKLVRLILSNVSLREETRLHELYGNTLDISHCIDTFDW